MFCNNCGSQISADAKFCKKCGAPISDTAENMNVQGGRSNYPRQNVQTVSETIITNPPIEEFTAEASDTTSRKKKGIGVAAVFNIILGVIVVLLIGAIVFLFVTNPEDEFIFGNDEEREERQEKGETVLKLEVDSTDKSTEAYSYTLKGTMSTSGGDAKLSINGRNVETVTEDDGKTEWSQEVLLDSGNNTFEIILYDSNGNSESKTVEIEHTTSLYYPRGTVLIKADEAGVFIRPTPEISDEFIKLIPSTDYTSQYVCMGEEHVDEDNFIWCKVKTPENAIGWVRSDLMWNINQ